MIPRFLPKDSPAKASLNEATILSEPQPCSWQVWQALWRGENSNTAPTFNTGFQDEEHCPALAQNKGGTDCKDSKAPDDLFNTCTTALLPLQAKEPGCGYRVQLRLVRGTLKTQESPSTALIPQPVLHIPHGIWHGGLIHDGYWRWSKHSMPRSICFPGIQSLFCSVTAGPLAHFICWSGIEECRIGHRIYRKHQSWKILYFLLQVQC